MLHDPEMECTCDNSACNESVFLPMSWSVGGYDLLDSRAESLLNSDHGWIVEGSSHYCSIECCKNNVETINEGNL